MRLIGDVFLYCIELPIGLKWAIFVSRLLSLQLFGQSGWRVVVAGHCLCLVDFRWTLMLWP